MAKIINEEDERDTESTNFDFYEEFEILKNNFERDNKTRNSVSTAPTYTPKTFLEQFVLYDDGTNQRLYVYVNGSWKYSDLT